MAHRTLSVVIAGFVVAVAPVAFGQADLRLVFSNTNGGGCGAPCGGVSSAVYAGVVSSYSAELENAGPNTASNVTLTVTLPLTVTVDHVTAYNLTCSVSQTIAATTVTCTAPSMPMTVAAGSLALVAHLPQNYPYQNGITASATLTATTPDPHPADNAVTETAPDKLKRCVIVLTAVAPPELRSLDGKPVFRIIRKPFDLDELEAAVVECSEGSSEPADDLEATAL